MTNHLRLIKRLQIFSLLLWTMSLTNTVFGQVKKSEQELRKFFLHLQKSKIDTFLIIKSGCIGCEVKYEGTSKTITDGQSIYVLTQHKGQFKVAVFDDIHKQKYFSIDTCSIFEFVHLNKATLVEKENFYKNEISKIKSNNGFFPPSPIHYSYEELKIHLSNFKYEFKIVDDNKDHYGLKRDKESWFISTKEIIEKVFSYL